MNILHIWNSDYPWDIRVEKINDALLENGHNVSLLCRNLEGQKPQEHYRGIEIYRLPTVAKHLPVLNSLVSVPVYFNPYWKKRGFQVVEIAKPDLIIVRDLPLALMAISLGKKYSLPVVLDMAENYPCMYQALLQCDKYNLRNYIIRNPYAAKLVERVVIQNITKIVVVIEESKQRLVSIGADPNKIVIVRNTPPDDVIYPRYIPEKVDDEEFCGGQGFRLLYNGYTNPPRGILHFVEQFPNLLQRFPDLKLIINGKGMHDNKIHRAIQNLNMKKSVFHKGWVSHEDKLRYLYNCDVGLLPYFLTSHWNTTIPNKLFDYMAMKKPVLATRAIPTARIVSETNCGLIYDRENLDDLCEKLEILSDVKRRKYFGDSGYEGIVSRYNWNRDKQHLVDLVNEF